MELCSGAWTKLSSMMGKVAGASKVQSQIVKGKAKCPKCGEEFDVELTIEQKVAGSILSFDAKPSGGLLDLCPWSEKKK